MRKILAMLLVVVMLFTLVAGCSTDAGDDDNASNSGTSNATTTEAPFDLPDFIYTAQSLPLPGDVGDVQHLAFAGGRIYFTAMQNEFDEGGFSFNNRVVIYSMNADGSEPAPLENYKDPVEAPEDASGWVNISAMNTDADGNIWIVENYNFSIYNLPDDFDADRDDPSPYFEDLGSGMAMRKLDNTGRELQSLDLAEVLGRSDNIWIQTFSIDGKGNIYIAVNDWETNSNTIQVLGNDGTKVFEIPNSGYFDEFLRLNDGTIAFADQSYTPTSPDSGRTLQTIDFAAKSPGKTIELPDIGWQVYPGSGGYDVLINNNAGDSVFGIVLGEEEPVKLLNWLESNIVGNDIQNVTILSEDHIICTSRQWSSFGGRATTEIMLLTKTPYSEIEDRTVITLATMYAGNLRDMVVKFNRENPDYRVQVIDYRELTGDWDAGVTRLTTEIAAGRWPDIISTLNIPYREYAQKGLFVDLYPLIDADPELSRDDFMQQPLKASEIDGKLYQMIPTFGVSTIVGSADVLGETPGWTMDEFMAVIRDNPNADIPAGIWYDRMNLLFNVVMLSIADFVDFEAGTVSFDTPEFIRLIEYAGEFPDVPEYNTGSEYVPEDEVVAAGRQIMMQVTVADFMFYMYYKELFGGEVVFKGIPADDRNGNQFGAVSGTGIAVVAQSGNIDGAWAFIRSILLDDVLWDGLHVGFPITKKGFDAAAEQETAREDGSYGINNLTLDAPKQEDIDAIVALIESTNRMGDNSYYDVGLMEIINEGVEDYFNGLTSAEEAARIIQDRAGRYVAERSG